MADEYKVKCPQCHKAVTKRGLSAHIRMAHPESSESTSETQSAVTGSEQGLVEPSDPEHPSTEQEPPQPSEQQLGIEQMRGIFGDLMRERDNQFLSQLPGLMEQWFESKMQQVAAQVQGRPVNEALGSNPESPAAMTVEGQPATGGGKLEQLMSMMQMAQKIGLVPDLQQQQNPTDTFVKQLEGLSKVIGAIDTIRGGGGSGMSPNAALGWMKFGHELGASGAPAPQFPEQITHVPPSPEMGKEQP